MAKKIAQQKQPAPDKQKGHQHPALNHPLFQQFVFKDQSVFPDSIKVIDVQKIKDEIESKNKKIINKISFDVKYFLFAIVQIIFVNLLIFKQNYEYINFDLVIFSALMLGRTIYLKIIAHNSYLGIQVRNNQANRHVMLNMIMLVLMIIQIIVVWRLFIGNNFHNFICLFYPIMFELLLFGIQTKYALIDQPNQSDCASNQRYSSSIHEFQHLVKAIVFQSFELAYFTGFITVKFIPQDLVIYFDSFSVYIFTLFLWINSVTILFSHYLQMRCIELQFNAQLLGKWTSIKKVSSLPATQSNNISQESSSIDDLKKTSTISKGERQSAESSKANLLTHTIQLNTNDLTSNPSNTTANAQGNNQISSIITTVDQLNLPSWNQVQSYHKDQVISYKKKAYQAVSDIGNFSKPDDLFSLAIYETFNQPSRTFIGIHSIYGMGVLLYTLFALAQRIQLYLYLGQLVASYLMMLNSFKFSKNVTRKYAFINQLSAV
ncbi:UNKNOWN [Stylonychia lemnae]|uniref:Transmembrane protein n=1 Tax=Stylonychia lemnae TaxID=5949 RepID=A0A078B6I9_STYLE|nr:UNKNOWN [Stylonychia lemnae]|eukprot:CDW90145.1 UNKNOWN [Stylonychia lemnae]